MHALSHTSSCCPEGTGSNPGFKNGFVFKSRNGAERIEPGKSEKGLDEAREKQFGAVLATLEAKELVEEKLATSLSHRCLRFLACISLEGGTLENLAAKMLRDSSCPLETQEVPFSSARAKPPKVSQGERSLA